MIYISAAGVPSNGRLGIEWMSSSLWVQEIVRLVGNRRMYVLPTGSIEEKVKVLEDHNPELFIEIGLNHLDEKCLVWYNDPHIKELAYKMRNALTVQCPFDGSSDYLYSSGLNSGMILSTINCPGLSIRPYGFAGAERYAGLWKGGAVAVADVLNNLSMGDQL